MILVVQHQETASRDKEQDMSTKGDRKTTPPLDGVDRVSLESRAQRESIDRQATSPCREGSERWMWSIGWLTSRGEWRRI